MPLADRHKFENKTNATLKVSSTVMRFVIPMQAIFNISSEKLSFGPNKWPRYHTSALINITKTLQTHSLHYWQNKLPSVKCWWNEIQLLVCDSPMGTDMNDRVMGIRCCWQIWHKWLFQTVPSDMYKRCLFSGTGWRDQHLFICKQYLSSLENHK